MFVTKDKFYSDRSSAIVCKCDNCGVEGPHGKDVDMAKTKAVKQGWATVKGKRLTDPCKFVCFACTSKLN